MLFDSVCHTIQPTWRINGSVYSKGTSQFTTTVFTSNTGGFRFQFSPTPVLIVGLYTPWVLWLIYSYKMLQVSQTIVIAVLTHQLGICQLSPEITIGCWLSHHVPTVSKLKSPFSMVFPWFSHGFPSGPTLVSTAPWGCQWCADVTGGPGAVSGHGTPLLRPGATSKVTDGDILGEPWNIYLQMWYSWY